MAYPDAVASRLGAVNADATATDAAQRALFLKVFSGEILGAFKEVCVTMDRTMVRTITSGKSATFPATWKSSAAYHTPGTEVVSTAINHNERIISIDGLLLASAFIANLDEAMNHYDVRAEYKNQLGYAIANQADKHLLQLIVIAARTAATVSGGFGGSVLTNADYATSPNTLVTGFFDGATALDEKDVPEDGQRYGFLPSAGYHMLIQSDKAVNRDWNDGAQNGSVKSGKVLELSGISIVKSNHTPKTDLSGTAIDNPAFNGNANDYGQNFATTVGMISHKTAVGTVKLMDLSFEQEYEIRRQGWLLVAKMAVGHGVLRPECAIELKTS